MPTTGASLVKQQKRSCPVSLSPRALSTLTTWIL